MSLINVSYSFLLFFLIIVFISFTNGTIDDHKTLIFHHCSTQNLNDPNGEYMDARTMLFEKLQFDSSQTKFSRSFVLVGDNLEGSVSGFFQCRQDLDDHKCYECMNAFRNVSNGVCANSMAARIQLSGCHVQYESDKYNDIFTLDEELNHKCGENQAMVSIEYFEQMKRQAMEALESEIDGDDEGRIGFYSIKHEGFHAMAQCEVGLDECNCGKCVIDAIEIIEEECVGSIYGQVFLDLCYLRYEFNPHEFHGGGGGNGGFQGGQPGARLGKVAAIAIGGVALLFVSFLLLRCLKKKDDDL